MRKKDQRNLYVFMELTRWKEADNPFLNKMSDCGPSSQRPGRANQWRLFSTAVASSFIRLESRTRGRPRTVAQLIRTEREDLKRRRRWCGVGGAVGWEGGGRKRKWERRWLRHTGEGSAVTHWPHCQVNAIWVFYRRHCSHWHFECTSHTLSLSITHSLHFLGQPQRLTLSCAAALAEKFPARRVVVATVSEVRGGDDRNNSKYSRSRHV